MIYTGGTSFCVEVRQDFLFVTNFIKKKKCDTDFLLWVQLKVTVVGQSGDVPQLFQSQIKALLAEQD